MIIYLDCISGDEMFSDIYKIHDKGFFYEVEGKRITRSDNLDDSLFGANASAEEASEALDDCSQSGIDIILNHNLQETSFTKKQFMKYLKDYMKAVKTHMEDKKDEKVTEFVACAKQEVKKVLDDFDNYQFFTGATMNVDGMVGLLNYRSDGITPYMLFCKYGLLAEKC